MKKIISSGILIVMMLALPGVGYAADLSIPAMCYGGGTFIGYTVRPGDNLYRISSDYGFDATTLACINNITNPAQISIGQEILIPTENDLSHQIRGEETLKDIADMYAVNPIEIAAANDIWDTEELVVGAFLSIPGINPIQAVVSPLSNRSGSLFAPPVIGVISSSYGHRRGEFHTGLDIACPLKTDVKASLAGVVTFADWDGNYGYAVVIDHQNGYITRYAHNSEILVKEGQSVFKGQSVALSGSTGRSTGPHVHWEIIKNGITQNPMEYYR